MKKNEIKVSTSTVELTEKLLEKMKENEIIIKTSPKTEQLMEELIEQILLENGETLPEDIQITSKAIGAALPLLASCAIVKDRPVL